MNELIGKKVFVTGGTGFVGPWLIKKLLSEGAKVFALIRNLKIDDKNMLYEFKDKVHFLQGDLSESEKIREFLEKNKIEICFHLAAILISQNPIEIFKTNIEGTWNLLEVCKKVGVKKFIAGSTFKVYGDQKPPFEEKFALKGIGAYGASKCSSDILTLSYNSSEMKTAVVRCSNIYGGGDFDCNGIIQEVVRNLTKSITPVIRSDGTPKRDFIYVEDIIGAYIAVAKKLGNPDVAGQAFNFGSGKPISILELYKKIIEIYRGGTGPQFLGEGNGKRDECYVDITKAREILDWKPEYSLEEGLQRTIKWYKEYF